MNEDLDRDEVIRLLDQLGSEHDADASSQTVRKFERNSTLINSSSI